MAQRHRDRHTDRLSRRIRVKIRFEKPGTEAFTLKMVPGDNAAYSGGERGRNAAYRTTPADLGPGTQHTTGPDGTLVVDTYRTTAAGLNRYHFEATDTLGNTVQSHRVVTWRALFLQYLPMEHAARPDDLDAAKAEYRKHGVELVDAGVRQMDDAFIDLERLDALRDTARVAYGASGCGPRKPYVIAVVFGGHAAEVGETYREQEGVVVGPDAPDVTVSLLGDYLWYDMGDD